MKIELKALEHVYSGSDKALDGVNLTLEGNEPVAIIGQNGAGKTTLVKHFNGILRPTGGEVLVDGVNINERSTAEWSKSVGYVFQNPDDQLFLESVRKEFEFGPRQIGMDDQTIGKRVDAIAELVGLTKKLDVHPFDLTPTEKKFCTIGAVIMMDPSVVIFDEPTCGQDRVGNTRLAHIIEQLKEQGKLCITISHDMKFVTANFSRVIVMCHGRVLLDGPSTDVFAQTDQLRRSFVTPPPVTRVAQGAGLKETVFSVPAFINAITQERNHRG
ncbi:ATP-binding cassette domain-containing protein [Bifidobacterium imperatoris]|uniref:ABC transporter n=1 Tax=Bifidobacterium imperatoris TaxID=2020965 RepID=A0A2N5IU24_9BIFI|nr:ATP-binding cassette domain-containing protein [Bifidobacterium imperatoris]PLS25441.1 ABC transporter [Bifidobacterium imperatoris]QSY57021.1 ATP-binding cassette domain-containing protein [Bifidobacterium imperatoris]